MVRKSSKTSHVLNLLSHAKEVRTSHATQHTPACTSSQPESDMPALSIIDHTQPEADPVAKAIYEQLEKEASNDTIDTTSMNTIGKEANTHVTPDETTKPNENFTKITSPQETEAYETINVIQHLTREMCLSHMEKLRVCQCPHCQEDTIALALNQLPSKYKVLKDKTLSQLLDEYREEYASKIAVALTKACIVVKLHPNHKNT